MLYILSCLVFGVICAALAVLAYGVRLRRKRTGRALYMKLCARPIAAEGLALSFFHLAKAGRVLLGIPLQFRLCGVSEQEMLYILPTLLYFEGCVYAGDQVTESGYLGGAADSSDSAWSRSMAHAATRLGIQEEALLRELELLKGYFSREHALMVGEELLTDSAICAINLARSHDIGFLLRAGLRLLGRPVPEPLLAALKPWLALREIVDDLDSYEQDVRDRSFNTLRLLVRLHSPERAAAALEQLRRDLLDQQIALLRQLDRPYIDGLIGFFLERATGLPLELIKVLARGFSKKTLISALERLFRSGRVWTLGKIPKPIAE